MPNFTVNKDVWRSRWTALEQTIDHTLAEMKEGRTERQGTLKSTLTALKTFGARQFRFFLNGFDKSSLTPLEQSAEYPPEFALRTTLDQVAYDMDVIVRAWQQRLPSITSPAMIETLNKADILAYRALAPAVRQGLIKSATVVTYFQKSANVRIIPYAPVTFVGIPLTALTTRQDLLAIPHEVGHYVYRHRQVRKTAKANTFADQPAWFQGWIEEIFADVYGALIGGPLMALSFEEMVTDDPLADFTKDDGEHPVAALRPDIYHAVIAHDDDLTEVHGALVKRWNEWKQQRGAPTSFTVHETGEKVKLDDAQPIIRKVVTALLEDGLSGLPVAQVWSGELPKGKQLDSYFKQFSDCVARLPQAVAAHVPEVEIVEDKKGNPTMRLTDVKEGLALPPIAHPLGAVDDSIEALIPSGQLAGGPISPDKWMALLDGSGWTTEGPGANSH